jgi:DNA invertase Pin-like site-specific DNA recombinase
VNFKGQGAIPAHHQRRKNMIYGYARCSTNESKQDINRQVRELKAAGAEKIFLEYEHGDAVHKKEQMLLFDTVKEGDTIIVLEVPRLARSTKQLCDIIDIVKQRHLRLVIVGSITLDCRAGQADPMSEAFLQMAGVFSQLELAMIRARVKSGMANAKAKGAKIGRPPLTTEDIPTDFLRHYPSYKIGQLNLSELARVCNLSRTTVYKYIAFLEK